MNEDQSSFSLTPEGLAPESPAPENLAPEKPAPETLAPETPPAPPPAAPPAPPPSQSAEETAQPYRVLARKYRPARFEELIGQDAMVRTIANAFKAKRLAHAFMLTGTRGVGKTTTARILARALNYTDPNGAPAPSAEMTETRAHCEAILESRHVDVMEMDAASRTGIADIREIIDSVQYRPVMAPEKVYIIDEVHMLSQAAFNGLLKTLEEPPPHVTFIFATTEIRKVPLTVLSRCQRFDLRRLRHEETVGLLGEICRKEKVEAEPEALALIARAAEGSARDALSLLDQAIAHSGGALAREPLLEMLGYSGKAALLDLLDHIAAGRAAEALQLARTHYERGGDPLMILGELANMTHWLMRHKIAPLREDALEMSEKAIAAAEAMAKNLPVSHLSLLWQMLLKAMEETRQAPRPFAALEMALMRMIYLSGLPSAEEAAALLKKAGGGSAESAESAKGESSQRAESAVEAVLDAFPGAEILRVGERGGEGGGSGEGGGGSSSESETG